VKQTHNTDGTIELVDDEQLPIGKIEVQVKKIPGGQTPYQCPVELLVFECLSLPTTGRLNRLLFE